MKNSQRIVCSIIISLIITSCSIRDPKFAQPYLHRPFELKHNMYACQVQYRVFGMGQNYGQTSQSYGVAPLDNYYIVDPNDYEGVCEDSMFSITYRTVPSSWPRGAGDNIEKEWLIARLPMGTQYIIDHYIVPTPNAQLPTQAYITIVSGPYSGLHLQWMNFDITRETSSPVVYRRYKD